MKYCLYKRLQQNVVTKELLMEKMLEQITEEEKLKNSIIGDMIELLAIIIIESTKQNIMKNINVVEMEEYHKESSVLKRDL